ncbi:GNAT family N-acetyltransferase [Natrarchaeobaculum sulfurireducens]|uniref:Acetyltransferase (GNAT) family n=1 Tax=Natrarchaeobaculum sulfurireducens TaxID=2044521 RepID=A0A346PQ71_9EURY|nr:GNAT family N-acetyltransferase [Natrarchaeobaculum sulfurireducens]AXR78303.1 Acetyltransferase (GNAT) family [Natrarchaeobaculum sulfurireducens]AXR81666.1 sporulation regulator-like [Natrarchaeobaculum sulfurireducens]
MAIEIDHARVDELEAITDMWVALARSQRSHGSCVRADVNRQTMRETLAAHLTADGLLVARIDGDPVGFASVSVERGALDLDATRGTLSNLYVEPAYRDRGIGSKLLEAVDASFSEAGVDVVTLEVMAENDAARRFYHRHGFETFRVTMHRQLEDRSKNDTHSKEER